MQHNETIQFVLARLAIASVSLCVVLSYVSALNLFKRAEWLIYALSSHAFIIGYIAIAHIISIPIYLFFKEKKLYIENTVNIFTIIVSLYFIAGFYAYENS